MRRRHWRLAAALLMVGIVGLTGCGDDDEDEATTTATTDAEAAGGDVDKFCEAALDAETAISTGPQMEDDATEEERNKALADFKAKVDPSLARALENAPDDIKADATTLVAGFRKSFETGDDPFEDEAFVDTIVRVGEYEKENCGWDVGEVTATEYAFAGVAKELEPGVHGIELSNGGKEIHEIVVFRKKPGVTESAEEILALGEEQADTKMEFVMAAFAEPGEKGYGYSTLAAGDYFGVCFVPEGLTPEKAEEAEKAGTEPEGAPHFTKGMVTEFTVA